MIEEFISRSFILALGYAYPAFLCFKTLEKNKVGIQELRFWCQYWTIVAGLTVVEIFSDILISWLPMYRVMKLAVYIYLWHPSTKGTEYVYDILLRPYLLRYETDIDRCVFEAKERALNLVIHYWHDCTKLGSKWVLQMFQLLVSQSAAIRQPNSQSAENQQPNVSPPAPSPPPASAKTFGRAVSDLRPNVADPTSSKTFNRTVSELRRPPVGPSAPNLSKLPKSESMKLRLHSQAQFIDIQNSEPNQTRELEENIDSEHVDAVRIKSQ